MVLDILFRAAFVFFQIEVKLLFIYGVYQAIYTFELFFIFLKTGKPINKAIPVISSYKIFLLAFIKVICYNSIITNYDRYNINR